MDDSFEARLRATLNMIPAYTWYAAPSGALTFVNERCADYLGLAEDHPLRFGSGTGAAWDAHIPLLHPDDREESRRAWSTCLSTGCAAELSFRVRNAQGNYRWFLSRAEPLRANNGTVGYWIGINLDIEERKQAEDAQRRAEAELQQARTALAHRHRVSLLGEVTASLAHEIRQPIAAARIDAKVCVRALADESLDLKTAREAAARLVKDALWADEIIKRTRALYKKGTTHRERVDVNAVIREMAVLMQQEAAASSIAIRTEVAADIRDITADRVQMQQVLMNLMLNAIEAMKDTGGEVTVTSQLSEDRELLIAVRDTGVGLPAENPDQIFESFVTTKPHGTGMGLAIARSIVESHGGRLWAIPNTGPGATFLFTLPSEEDDTLASQQP
jgi:PAS domain S-box-containing protein